jgi:hypothetical protein
LIARLLMLRRAKKAFTATIRLRNDAPCVFCALALTLAVSLPWRGRFFGKRAGCAPCFWPTS